MACCSSLDIKTLKKLIATKSFKAFHLLQKKKSVQIILVAKKLDTLQSDHAISYLNIFPTSFWNLYMLTKGMGKDLNTIFYNVIHVYSQTPKYFHSYQEQLHLIRSCMAKSLGETA